MIITKISKYELSDQDINAVVGGTDFSNNGFRDDTRFTNIFLAKDMLVRKENAFADVLGNIRGEKKPSLADVLGNIR